MAVVELAYSEFGRSDCAPLIVLHGFFASSRNWRFIAERLAASHHVFVVDLRNHGASPHHPVMDYPAMMEDVRSFMVRRGLAKASLLGHSMGGKVAMWLALNDPGAVDKLIIADIAPTRYSHRFDSTISALKMLPLAAIGNRKQAEEYLAPAIPELGYRQFLLQNLVLRDGHYRWRVDLDIFSRSAPQIVTFPDAANRAPYSGDALFITGAESAFVKAETVFPLFPKARMKTLAGAGHWLHVQQPESFLAATLDFLRA
ncbi:alpha/beta fold hydrolase [Methylomicrobium album]|uniref:Putative hydrolase or acyltransferase of alpha/beta superfamily n=1 Tax=Methylomicrobium album BG8 TaxID=686340 RepID=H8GLS7_METAL|nr:alpha/beta fold hydrolase [Methylomicrobium album]EIC30604.1 putative hydrolase or acyltransferase of alpha/beta superfamily [Methylomicrobium album BG8]